MKIARLTEKFIEEVSIHVTSYKCDISTALQMKGIPRGTQRRWIQRGQSELKELDEGKRAKLSEYGLLWQAASQAQALNEAELRSQIFTGNDARVKLQLLKSMDPRKYSTKPEDHVDEDQSFREIEERREAMRLRLKKLRKAAHAPRNLPSNETPH